MPGSSVTAAYMTLSNRANSDRTLAAFSSEFAESVELHNHIHSEGQMQMRQVEELTLAAGKTLRFAPGGYHLMLMGVSEELQSLERISINVTTLNGQNLVVEALARELVSP